MHTWSDYLQDFEVAPAERLNGAFYTDVPIVDTAAVRRRTEADYKELSKKAKQYCEGLRETITAWRDEYYSDKSQREGVRKFCDALSVDLDKMAVRREFLKHPTAYMLSTIEADSEVRYVVDGLMLELEEEFSVYKRERFLPSITGRVIAQEEAEFLYSLDVLSKEYGDVTVYWDRRFLVIQDKQRCIFEMELYEAEWRDRKLNFDEVQFVSAAGRETLHVRAVSLEKRHHPTASERYQTWKLPIKRPYSQPPASLKERQECKHKPKVHTPPSESRVVFDALCPLWLDKTEEINTSMMALYKSQPHLPLLRYLRRGPGGREIQIKNTTKAVSVVIRGELASAPVSDTKTREVVLYTWDFKELRFLNYKIGMVVLSADSKTIEVPLHWEEGGERFVTLVYLDVLNQQQQFIVTLSTNEGSHSQQK